MSFVTALVKASYQPIHFIRTQDESGNNCYYFLMASWENIKKIKHIENAIIDFNQFGKIVQSGYGHAPTVDALLELKSKYDYDVRDVINQV